MGNRQNKTKAKKDKQEEDTKNNKFYMHIQFIGEDLTNFIENLKNTEQLKCIKDYWIFEKNEENISIENQINKYFQFLEKQNKVKNEMKKKHLL